MELRIVKLFGTVVGGCLIGLLIGQWASGEDPYHGRWGTWGGCVLGGIFGLVVRSRDATEA